MKSELRKKDSQLEASRDENRALAEELARRSRDESPVSGGGDSGRGDSPSSSGSEFRVSETRESETRGGSDDEQVAGRRSLRAALAENASLKKFLRDYGMTWVGDGDAREGEAKEKMGDGEDAKPEVLNPKRGKKVVSNRRLQARAEAARLNKPTANVPVNSEPSGASGADAAALASAVPRDASTEPLTEPLKKHDDESKNRSDDPPAVSDTHDHFAVDVEKLLASIAELNAVAGDGKSSVVVGAGGERRLEPRRAKTLTLFRDGFVVDDAPRTFRAFATSTRNRSYVRDLADGFFPYEYKEAYPEGVPFKLLDRSHESGAPPGHAFVAFTGNRARLDGKRGEDKTRVVQKTETEGEKKKDTAFLEKLPRVVVRDGAVVRVREGVGAAMRGAGGAPARTQTVLETTVARGCFRALLEAEGCSNGVDAARDDDAVRSRDAETCVSTLRVKGMDGQKMYIVKLAGDDTVGKLRRYLRSAGAGDDDNFEIRNAYPPRTFADDALTLRDAGLVPNATLLLRPA